MKGRGWARWLLYGLSLLGLFGLAYYLRVVLFPFLLSLVVAYMLAPVAAFLEQRGLRRMWAIIVIYAVLGLLLTGAVVFLLPELFDELQELMAAVPRHTRALQAWLGSWQDRYDRILLPDTVRQSLDNALVQLEDRAATAGTRAVTKALDMSLGILSLVLVPLLTYYMLKDGGGWKEQLIGLLPITSRPGWLRLLGRVDAVLAGFVRGELVISAIMGLAMTLLVWALGLPYAVILGIFAGVGEFVPYVGPLVGSLPAIAVAALHSPTAVVKLVIGMVILNQLEQMIVVPRVFHASTGLHPLLIVFVLLVGGQLFGLFGVLVAVPAAAITKEVILHLDRFHREH